MQAKIVLKPKKDEALRRFHPWVFSGAARSVEGNPDDGDWVELYSSDGTYLAAGHYQQQGSIIARILAWDKVPDPNLLIGERLAQALSLRRNLGLTDASRLNAYRLVFAEGDQLPGLIIDHYNGHLVVQCHSAGMAKSLPAIVDGLVSIYGPELKSIYNKSESTVKSWQPMDKHLLGDATSTEILENGCRYHVDWDKGQKTGFFLDQRDNRMLLASLSNGKSVLNTFSYTGGFSIAALTGGASLVHSVDSSAQAIAQAKENLILNGFSPDEHHCTTMDTLEFLKGCTQPYDMIILDPPAYAKHLSARHNAIQGYKRLNAIAMGALKPGGLLMTFSCSQVVDRRLFESTIMAAALESGQPAKIIARLSQPADHPVSLFHPEGEYLKGLLLSIGSY